MYVAYKNLFVLQQRHTQHGISIIKINICWGVLSDADAGLHCERLTMRIMRSEFY